MSLITELKRRNVFRVAIAYLVVAWLVVQVTDVMIDNIGAPGWVFATILMVLAVGFPLALLFAWAFEMTPEGLKRESEVDRSQSITPKTGRKLDRMIIGLLVLVAAYFIWEARFATPAKKGSEPFSEKGSEPFSSSTSQTANGQSEKGSDPFSHPFSQATIGQSEKGSDPFSAATDTRKSIVVLPFVNMSNDPDQEFFSDGLSEEILNALVRIENLRVISRTSAFAFKGKELSIPQIAEQLKVSHVLEGSVRKAGNDVRITAQLIEVETDSHLWSQAYSRSLESVFEIQADISQAIAGALEMALADGAAMEKPTDNIEAYQLYLRGRALYQTRDPGNLEHALVLLDEAVTLDPAYDEAWATLAATAIVQSFNVDSGFDELRARAVQSARTALRINPDNGLAYAVQGLAAYGQFDFQAAMKALDRAIEMNPQESNSLLWKAIVLSSLGYVDEAITMLRQAEAADPVFVNLQNWLVTAYAQKGDFEAARRHAQNAFRLDPRFPIDSGWEAQIGEGDLAGARKGWAEMAQLEGIPALAEVGKLMFDALEDPSKTAQSVQRIIELSDQTSYYGAFLPLFRLGAVDEAIAWIRKVRAAGHGLRAANYLAMLWGANDRAQLQHPALPAFFEEIGFVDYWRANGDPDYCRVDGSSIRCGDSP